MTTMTFKQDPAGVWMAWLPGVGPRRIESRKQAEDLLARNGAVSRFETKRDADAFNAQLP